MYTYDYFEDEDDEGDKMPIKTKADDYAEYKEWLETQKV
jgi:hypothetical protein